LLIARLEPENNIDLIIDEFRKSTSKKKLVIVAPLIKTSYVKKLLESESDGISFLGGIYEPKLQRTLRYNCFAYIHGHEVGGTNPTLVEALSCHNVILALDVPFNREVAGKGAFYFTKDPGNLTAKIEMLEQKKPDQLLEVGKKGYERYIAKYSVEGMIDSSTALFVKVFEHRLNRHPK
jgi:rhamnosyltransferase